MLVYKHVVQDPIYCRQHYRKTQEAVITHKCTITDLLYSMSFRYFAVADVGTANKTTQSNYAQKFNASPAMVLCLGDNFYPDGVDDVHDSQFQTTWRNNFLQHPSLRVPWNVILGNHDYMRNPHAQIEYHYHSNNSDKLWRMPSNCYSFKSDGLGYNDYTNIGEVSDNGSHALVQFFGIDTNGCQLHVREKFPSTESELYSHIDKLRGDLAISNAHWKVVFGHHPLYTQGLNHGKVAKCLRSREYSYLSPDGNECSSSGYNLEDVLLEGGVHAYFAGHEHVLQQHSANGIYHFGCAGAGSEVREVTGLYGGMDPNIKLDWVGKDTSAGFIAVDVSREVLNVRYVTIEGDIIREVNVTHPQCKDATK